MKRNLFVGLLSVGLAVALSGCGASCCDSDTTSTVEDSGNMEITIPIRNSAIVDLKPVISINGDVNTTSVVPYEEFTMDCNQSIGASTCVWSVQTLSYVDGNLTIDWDSTKDFNMTYCTNDVNVSRTKIINDKSDVLRVFLTVWDDQNNSVSTSKDLTITK